MDAIRKTLDYLITSGNARASDVLAYALDVPVEAIQTLAVSSLVRRGQADGYSELILRYGRLNAEQQAAVERAAPRMSAPLQDALDSPLRSVRGNARGIIRNSRACTYLGPLLQRVDAGGEPGRESLDLVRSLVESLHEDLASGKRPRSDGITPGLHNAKRKAAVKALAATLPSVEDARVQAELAELLLIIGDPGDAAIRALLDDDVTAALLARVRGTSEHPAVARFVVAALSLESPPPDIGELIQSRTDRPFVVQLLSALPDPIGQPLEDHLGCIRSLGWLDTDDVDLHWVPRELQGRLVALLSASGIPSDDKLSVIEWIVHHGSVMGRIAALELLTEQTEDVEDVIRSGLSSNDVGVQAWATTQLREHGIPQAFALLLEALQSPEDEVRDAARQELAGFNLSVMLSLAEQLPPETCRSAGALMMTIDPQTPDRLEMELRSPIGKRRLQVIRSARAMGLHVGIEDALLKMLQDEDAAVMRAAIEALGDCPSDRVRAVLRQLVRTGSPGTRKAAEIALQSGGRE